MMDFIGIYMQIKCRFDAHMTQKEIGDRKLKIASNYCKRKGKSTSIVVKALPIFMTQNLTWYIISQDLVVTTLSRNFLVEFEFEFSEDKI
jgi:hypothetical protein